MVALRAAEERAPQRPVPHLVDPVLRADAGELHGRRLEQERRQPTEVACVEGVAERVEDGRCDGPRLRRLVGHELGAAPVEGRLDGPGRGRQRLGRLVERQPEDVLQRDRGPLLRRELGDERPRRLARGTHLGARARLGARRRRPGELAGVPDSVEPQVRGDPKEPRAGAPRWSTIEPSVTKARISVSCAMSSASQGLRVRCRQ